MFQNIAIFCVLHDNWDFPKISHFVLSTAFIQQTPVIGK